MINVERANGNWEAKFNNLTYQEVIEISKESNVKEVSMYKNIGITEENFSDEEFPIKFNIKAYDKNALKNDNIHLIEGRFPENDNEIIVSMPEYMRDTLSKKVKVGETITLTTSGKPKKYKIVGKADRLSFDFTGFSRYELGMITLLDEEDLLENSLLDITILTNNIYKITETVSNIANLLNIDEYTGKTSEEKLSDFFLNIIGDARFDETGEIQFSTNEREIFENILNDNGEIQLNTFYSYNKQLLNYEGIIDVQSDFSIMMAEALGVVIFVIAFVATIMLYTSFKMTYNERIKEFGLLNSIGMSKKQRHEMIKKETQILGIIGMLTGIAIGLFISLILSHIINIALQSYHYDILSYGTLELIVDRPNFYMKVPALLLVLSIIILYLIILLSNTFAIRKLNKQSTIEIIKNTTNTKIKKKILRTPRIVAKIFGEEGSIAYKNIRRDKSRHKTIVVSIVISIILFLCVSELITDYFKKSLYGQYYQIGDFKDCEITVSNYEGVHKLIEYLENNKLINDYFVYEKGITNYNIILEKNDISKDMSELVKNGVYTRCANENIIMPTNTQCFKDKAYTDILNKIGISDLKKDEVIITNSIVLNNINKKKINITNLNVGDTYTLPIAQNRDGKTIEKNLKIVGILDDFEPYINLNSNTSNIYMMQIVNEETLKELNKIYYKNELNGILEESSREYSVILNTDKALEIELNSEEIKKIPYVQGIISLDLYYQTEKSQKIIVEVLIYTFMALLTAIATLNIYNIVYFSTLLRKKEFAELKSIGMSNRQINKMFILQGILYAIDSIIWGLSISIGILYINYIIQTSKVQAMVMLFHIPWLNILICLVVVYATIFMAIRNARKKIKESNIIDEIKNDNI